MLTAPALLLQQGLLLHAWQHQLALLPALLLGLLLALLLLLLLLLVVAVIVVVL